MNYVRSNSLSLKYQGFPPSDSQDIGIRKFECEYLHFTTSSIVNTEYDLSRHLTIKYIPGLN